MAFSPWCQWPLLAILAEIIPSKTSIEVHSHSAFLNFFKCVLVKGQDSNKVVLLFLSKLKQDLDHRLIPFLSRVSKLILGSFQLAEASIPSQLSCPLLAKVNCAIIKHGSFSGVGLARRIGEERPRLRHHDHFNLHFLIAWEAVPMKWEYVHLALEDLQNIQTQDRWC